MTTTDELLANATGYQVAFTGDDLSAQPVRRVTVVACMDARIDLFALLGLRRGDAHLIRNAGGRITEDVLRSLAISQRELGTREIMLIHHTACGLTGFDDAAFRAALTEETGETPGWDVPGFADPADGVRESVDLVRGCAWLPHRDAVRGFVFDVRSGTVAEV